MDVWDAFWAHIDRQRLLLCTAKSAEDVITVLGGKMEHSSGDAFFAGSGGDGSIMGPLVEAGWSVLWEEADYHWAMQAPDGSVVTYCEGDVFLGNQRPLPHGEPK